MTFDNSAPSSPTTWQTIKAHAPLVAIVGGGLVLFISLHIAAYTVAVIAGVHLIGGLVAGLIARIGPKRRLGSSGAGK